ncbi:MAG TPA: ABC transporter ATP-binding protein [Candidatus Limnocylindria bacterium]|jgi:molybdate transport system ATP-binding protein|nr:ABC transporter ATP-binding protein [Candidatus Limnocylindria bacterium]
MLTAHIQLRLGTLDLDAAVEAAPGEIVALLGPNGAGKTTFLRALAGLVRPDRARVVLDDVVLEDTTSGVHLPTERRPIGIVFQQQLLFPHLSVLENVAFGLRARHRPDATSAAMAWLERVGLGRYAGARPAALSGGEAQRVALARALAIDPRLLLLDEPLSALDATTRVEVRRELRRHLASFSGARLLVTHDPLEAAALADRLVILEEGRVVQGGPVDEVTRHPRSRFVADLVGVNLLRGRADGGVIALEGGQQLTALDAADGAVFAVIHPRSVAIHRMHPEGTPRNVWAGTVRSVDILGERARVWVGGTLPIVAEVTASAVRDLELRERTEVWVSVKAAEVGVYPA